MYVCVHVCVHVRVCVRVCASRARGAGGAGERAWRRTEGGGRRVSSTSSSALICATGGSSGGAAPVSEARRGTRVRVRRGGARACVCVETVGRRGRGG